MITINASYWHESIFSKSITFPIVFIYLFQTLFAWNGNPKDDITTTNDMYCTHIYAWFVTKPPNGATVFLWWKPRSRYMLYALCELQRAHQRAGWLRVVFTAVSLPHHRTERWVVTKKNTQWYYTDNKESACSFNVHVRCVSPCEVITKPSMSMMMIASSGSVFVYAAIAGCAKSRSRWRFNPTNATHGAGVFFCCSSSNSNAFEQRATWIDIPIRKP